MVALKNCDGPGDEATYLLLQAKIVSYIVSLSTHGRLPGTLVYLYNINIMYARCNVDDLLPNSTFKSINNRLQLKRKVVDKIKYSMLHVNVYLFANNY